MQDGECAKELYKLLPHHRLEESRHSVSQYMTRAIDRHKGRESMAERVTGAFLVHFQPPFRYIASCGKHDGNKAVEGHCRHFSRLCPEGDARYPHGHNGQVATRKDITDYNAGQTKSVTFPISFRFPNSPFHSAHTAAAPSFRLSSTYISSTHPSYLHSSVLRAWGIPYCSWQ